MKVVIFLILIITIISCSQKAFYGKLIYKKDSKEVTISLTGEKAKEFFKLINKLKGFEFEPSFYDCSDSGELALFCIFFVGSFQLLDYLADRGEKTCILTFEYREEGRMITKYKYDRIYRLCKRVKDNKWFILERRENGRIIDYDIDEEEAKELIRFAKSIVD